MSTDDPDLLKFMFPVKRQKFSQTERRQQKQQETFFTENLTPFFSKTCTESLFDPKNSVFLVQHKS